MGGFKHSLWYRAFQELVGDIHAHRMPQLRLTRRHYIQLAVGCVILVTFLVWLGLTTTRSSGGCAFKIAARAEPIPERRGRLDTCVELEQAKTNSALIRGLSGRVSMPRTQGMLFVFDEPGKQCMWMKDMHFSLDMLWLDEQQKVVHVEHDVRPETYPQSFCSKTPAKYVVEVNSGIASEAGIQPGQHINF